MQVCELATPSFLLDLDAFETNLADMAAVCREAGVELWPMVKTHKCAAIAWLQRDRGAAGFLTGTLDEAEQLIECGFTDIMLAYPVAGRRNIARVCDMARLARIIVAFDGVAAARDMAAALAGAGLALDYLIIVDSGLHRFGVAPRQAGRLAADLSGYKQLNLRGIATHPGQVYGATGPAGVAEAARAEIEALAAAKQALRDSDFTIDIVATGSTPTAARAAASGIVTVLRPGNYVFYDNVQVALGVTTHDRCALTVLATILSQPRPDTFIIDVGSKCLGLDKGAHGSTLIEGYGIVRDHPELSVAGLSEEVGRVMIKAPTDLTVGDKLAIIPNHACSAANMTSWLAGHRNGRVECAIPVDMRGNAWRQPPVPGGQPAGPGSGAGCTGI